jgi:hypothetical protein
MEGGEEEIHVRFRFSIPESTDASEVGAEPEMGGKVMNLPKDGPQVEGWGLEGRDTVSVEPQSKVPFEAQ